MNPGKRPPEKANKNATRGQKTTGTKKPPGPKGTAQKAIKLSFH